MIDTTDGSRMINTVDRLAQLISFVGHIDSRGQLQQIAYILQHVGIDCGLHVDDPTYLSPDFKASFEALATAGFIKREKGLVTWVITRVLPVEPIFSVYHDLIQRLFVVDFYTRKRATLIIRHGLETARATYPYKIPEAEWQRALALLEK